MNSQGLCDTTKTERFSNPDCKCNSYKGNLGPCLTFQRGLNGKCAYCDHTIECHDDLQELYQQCFIEEKK